MFEEDTTNEVDTTSEESIEQDTSILVNYTIDKNANPAGTRNLMSTVYEKIPNSKTEVNKSSTPTNELVTDGFTCRSVNKHIIYSVPKLEIACNHSLIEPRASGEVSG